MRGEIRYLKQRVKTSEQDKDQLIDNFKLTSGVLLERLKDLEAAADPISERPETANVLSKICK